MKKSDCVNEIEDDVEIQQYNGPKKPPMPDTMSHRGVLPLKLLTRQVLSGKRAEGLDFKFLEQINRSENPIEFGGFNMQACREELHEVKPKTTAIYMPLIDITPSDPTTMMTAMVQAQQLTSGCGQAVTVFTADQQLYQVMVDITWVYPELFSNFIQRLGVMHIMMNFIGSICTNKLGLCTALFI